MNNCYICNDIIDFKNGSWSPYIINNKVFKKCSKCTELERYVMTLNVDIKDIEAFQKILNGFSYDNYLRNNLVHIVYYHGNYELLCNMLNDIGFGLIGKEFLISDNDIYKRVISSFK